MQIPDLHAYVTNRVRFANYDTEGVTIKLADAEDFHRLAATVDKFQGSTRIADRTGRGDICVVAYKYGALAHFRWAALNPIPAWGGHTVHLDSHEAYTYDGYTLPAFRWQGIGSEARIFLTTYLTQQGIRCAYSDTRTDNRNTQQARIKWIREGRARLLGVVTVAKWLGRIRCTFVADTADTRSLIARLFHLQLSTVRVRTSAS
jgi:GNAT superfamily N-acetyltransferase